MKSQRGKRWRLRKVKQILSIDEVACTLNTASNIINTQELNLSLFQLENIKKTEIIELSESNISNINFELGYFYNNIKLSLPLQDIHVENIRVNYIKVNGLDMQNINIENNKINFSFDLIGKNISLGKKTIQVFMSDNNANYIFIGTNIIKEINFSIGGRTIQKFSGIYIQSIVERDFTTEKKNYLI